MSDELDKRKLRRLMADGEFDEAVRLVRRRGGGLAAAQRHVFGMAAHDVAASLLPSSKGKVHLVRAHRGGYDDGAVLWSACGLALGILPDPATRARITWGNYLPFRARTEEGDAQRKIWASTQHASPEPCGITDGSACKTCAWVLLGATVNRATGARESWDLRMIAQWQSRVAKSLGVVPFDCRRGEHFGDPCEYCQHATAPLFGLA